MQVYRTNARARQLQESAEFATKGIGEDVPRPGELFFQAGIAIVLPLLLALVVQLYFEAWPLAGH